MGLYETIDDLYQQIFNYHEYSRIFLTLAALFGSLILIIYLIRFLYALVQGFCLYVVAQWKCCQPNLVERYGKWALVTGATDGIGQSLAKEFASRGMSILVVARNESKLAATKAMLEAVPNVGQVETIKIDLSDVTLENFERACAQIDPDKRDIGILVNNAGTFPDRFMRFNRFEKEDLANMANLNMVSPVHITRMVMPGMVARGRGLVLNVSSVVGFVTVPYMSIYSSTKTFLNAFTKQLQVEYAAHPIDVVLLTPGPVHTRPFKAGWTLDRPTPFNPSPDDYARVTVNALSLRFNQLSGYLIHGLMIHWNALCESLGLLYILVRLNLKVGARTFQLSPVPRRKKLNTTAPTDVAVATESASA